jgi:uncharacterized protein (TIGR02231 family)
MLTTVDTAITKVTVYTDRALITRQGNVQLTGTETQLVIEKLPMTIDPESIRVSGRGQAAVKILGVNSEFRRFTQPVNDKIAEVTAQIEALTVEQQQIQTQMATVQMQSDFVIGLQQKTEETFSNGLAKQKISLLETLGFIDTIGQKFTEYATSIANYRQQHQELEKQLQVYRSRLNSFSNPQATESYQIIVDMEIAAAGQFQLEVSYVVERASWQPLYDLRIDTTSRQLQLTYLAEITQRTGEDWTNVALTLSTAQPGLGTLPPQLNPWYVDWPHPVTGQESMRRRQPSPASSALTMMAGEVEVDDSVIWEEGAIAAENVVSTTNRQGGVVIFQLAGGGNIPNDGSPHKATIFRQELPCQLNYIAMPILVGFTYLRARVQNPSEGATLLPGNANIFRDEMFVGTTNLENIAPGQDFQLNLGIDESISIDRQLVERQVEKKFLGNNRRIVYAFRLQLHNLQSQAVKLQLADRIPHSRSEKIKIKLLKTNPANSLGELGRLNWELDMAAQQKLEVYYQFSIEHPEDGSVLGLDI